MKLRIALDLDDTIFDWRNEYSKIYGDINKQESHIITRNVRKLEKNRNFWSNLPLLEKPNFNPAIYSTKRINNKSYTIANLEKYDLPIKPIYQTRIQTANKVDIIKGVSDILIDDSPFNVLQALNVGFPALLISREHNKNSNILFRINSLDIEEILQAYEFMIKYGKIKYTTKSYSFS